MKKYIHSGKCIWCGKSEPYATFFSEPHIIPHSLGGSEIGFDVCDECNHFFGTCSKNSLNTNLVFKEVFNASMHSITYKQGKQTKYSSAFFHYNKNKGLIKLKRYLSIRLFTDTFKRSLYEVFLQKYHFVFPDEPLDKFEAVRRYARYGIGNLHVYFVYNSGFILHCQNEKDDIVLSINEYSKKEIENTGYFVFLLVGHILILEVLPITAETKGKNSLRDLANKYILHIDNTVGLYELNDIRFFDMFFNRLSDKHIDSNNKLFK